MREVKRPAALSGRMPSDLRQQLDDAHELLGVPRSTLIERALRAYLAEVLFAAARARGQLERAA